ncbi:MAG: (d)CMP kinase [Pirellulales bacterium]|nr:(d)CMP kinase [Pirellulales bacterium]
MIVTIDGPAGAGKSTVARALARRLGYRFLDTGAMYRAVALAALERNVALDDPQAMGRLAQTLRIELPGDNVLLDGRDVTAAIRTPHVTRHIHYAADNPAVRAHLVTCQRQLAEHADVVTEGRDQGTVVFPRAECKFFLTASPEERARRRVAELAARGQEIAFDEVLADQNLRDARDAAREVGPLVRAADAIEVLTDGLSREQVIDQLEALVRRRAAQG